MPGADKAFGSLDEMKAKFNAAAAARFGSGWAWLGLKSDGDLTVTTTANQDNPLQVRRGRVTTMKNGPGIVSLCAVKALHVGVMDLRTGIHVVTDPLLRTGHCAALSLEVVSLQYSSR